jgi:signal peptidase II
MVTVKNAIKKFPKKDWRLIQLLKNAWIVNKNVLILFLAIFFIGVDQLLKFTAIQKNLPDWEIFLNNFCNSGISLGLEINQCFFWFFWLMALIFLLILIKKFNSFFLWLVLAGALSNFIDRFFYGCVVDYISIWNFPIFNLADFFISFGFIGFLVYQQLLESKK